MSGGSPDKSMSHPVSTVDLVILNFGSVSRLGVCRVVSWLLAPFGAKVPNLFDNRCPAPRSGAPTRSGPEGGDARYASL